MSHNLKSGFVISGSGESYSQIRSRIGIQVTAKWQFCNTTQSPVFCPYWIIFSATGPCPWPKEIGLIIFFLDCAKELKEANGSDPGLRMKIKGETELESPYILARSKGGGVMNFSPS